MGAASRGARVVMMEKAATLTSGAMGSGCDHWEMAATNPCSRVTPEELADAMIRGHRGYNNGISHYIEARECYDRLLDLERFGAKIRDTEDEFKGADFRDDATKLMFAYDYDNRFTLRVWGATFKTAMYRGAKQMKAQVLDRTMAAGLLTEGGRMGARVVGAVAIDGRTGQVHGLPGEGHRLLHVEADAPLALRAGSHRDLRVPAPECTGDGHAMAWRVGGRSPCSRSRAEPSGRGSAAFRRTPPATTTTPGTPARWSTRRAARSPTSIATAKSFGRWPSATAPPPARSSS